MNRPSDTQADGLAEYLDPDERILWQGRPSPRFRLVFRNPLEAVFALLFFGFSVLLVFSAAQAGGPLWIIALFFLAISFYELFGTHLSDAWRRRHTGYALTSRRALIATKRSGRDRLASYPITATTEIELIDGSPGSILFARGRLLRKTWRGRKADAVGFDLIEDAREVFALMRKVQTEGAA